MPLLTLTTTMSTTDNRAPVAEALADLYATLMETETTHVAVVVNETPADALWLGRMECAERGLCFVEADVRRGRSADQKRAFALAVIDLVHERWGVPRVNQKVVFTEHAGGELMGHERVGEEWSSDGG